MSMFHSDIALCKAEEDTGLCFCLLAKGKLLFFSITPICLPPRGNRVVLGFSVVAKPTFPSFLVSLEQEDHRLAEFRP